MVEDRYFILFNTQGKYDTHLAMWLDDYKGPRGPPS